MDERRVAMVGDIEITKKDFMELPAKEIRRIVLLKNKPRAGVFVADGNRRLVMCKKRLVPTSDEFYQEYARFFVDSLKKTLSIFFNHGLNTLFFPLIGPSVLLRKNKFQIITVPTAIHEIFRSSEWLQFYGENGIRVKAYGDLSQLEKIGDNHPNLLENIKHAIAQTASNDKHKLFFGVMAENTPGLEMPQQIIDFYKLKKRPPTPQEMIEIYYGEIIPPADFLIISNKFSGQSALPPLISTQKAKMYFFPVPGFLALNKITYRKILYDLLFIQPQHPVSEYSDDVLNNIESLDNFYQRYKNTIVGTGKKIDEFWVPDLTLEEKWL